MARVVEEFEIGHLAIVNNSGPCEYRGKVGVVVGIGRSCENEGRITLEYEDGEQVVCRPEQVDNQGPWQIHIMPNSPWKIAAAPYGTGVALLVERGIPCADHTHCVSAHTTNWISYWEAKKVVERLSADLAPKIEKFVDLVQSFGFGGKDEAFRDTLGALFCNYVVETVAAECERPHFANTETV